MTAVPAELAAQLWDAVPRFFAVERDLSMTRGGRRGGPAARLGESHHVV